jgi:F-type H+-transporting ATPase subunit gamma
MQKLVEVKRRMATVRSIQTVSRTMATVASAKLSRTRERAAGIRLYTEEMRRIVQRQQAYGEGMGLDLTKLSPFLTARPVRRAILLHLASDRGMCGAYNMSINRVAAYFLKSMEGKGVPVEVIVKGDKGERYLRNRLQANITFASSWTRAGVTDDEVDALFDRLSNAFLTGEVDEVWCSYTRFYSPLRRQPRVVRLLPLVFEQATGGDDLGRANESDDETPPRWFYEPDLGTIVAELLGELLRMQVEDVLLESYASEQGARMITMEEATERADKTLHELGVAYNRLRREMITTDLIGVLFASRMIEEEEQSVGRASG